METKSVTLKKQRVERANFSIKGISPLIMNAWDEFEIKAIENKRNKVQKSKDERTPDEKVKGKLHKFENNKDIGFPAVGFKKAMVRAGVNLDYKMKQLQTQFFVMPDKNDPKMVKIDGSWEIFKEAIPLPKGGLDIRFRPIFKNWSANLEIEYNANLLSYEQIAQLLMEAGFACGIGDRRPERTPSGIYGRWEII